MALASRSRRSAAGIAFLVAGGLVLLDVVLRLAGIAAIPWLSLAADWALTAGFVVLALAVASVVVRVAAIVAAAGWFLLGLNVLIGLPMGFSTLVALAAAGGGVVAAVALLRGTALGNRPAVAFVVANGVGAALLLSTIGGLALGVLAQLLLVLFGGALVVAGVLFPRAKR